MQKEGHADKALHFQPYELKKIIHDEKLRKLVSEKKDIVRGSQIRSYLFQPYQPVKDHRTSVESGNANGVMDGDLKQFIDSYLVAGSGTIGQNAVKAKRQKTVDNICPEHILR